MPKRTQELLEQDKPNYDYPVDGLIRRQLHEFGSTGINPYAEILRKMHYLPSDVALDVGAGMGHDGLHVAEMYHPRAVYLLEPLTPHPYEFDQKYVHLEAQIRDKGIGDHVKLLVAADAFKLTEALAVPGLRNLAEGISYLQPLPGTAEAIPLPDHSISKLSMIHSAYEFDDLVQAMHEAERVLTAGGIGVLVTNGPDDKMVFKETLRRAGEKLRNPAPETVSSKLDYNDALAMLQNYFDIIDIYIHQDEMIITPERFPLYRWSYDSYRHLFARPIVNDGRWITIRQGLLDIPVAHEMAVNDAFKDTIDIGAIYFKRR